MRSSFRFAVVAAVSALSSFPRPAAGPSSDVRLGLGDAIAEATADGLTSDPTAVSWGSGRIDVLARGPDNALWHRWYDGQWSGWESLGGSLASGPDVASWGSGRLDVFARGTDNTLQHKYYNGQWSGWESLGGGLTSDPSAVAWGAGRLDVFARGGDYALWHISYANAWSGWESLGGSLASGPDVSSWGAGRLDVFALGKDNTLQHKWYQKGWSAWESLKGSLTSDPAAVSWSSGRIDVFARGADNALWHVWYAGSWSGWESLGGGLSSAPDASSWGSGRLDVFVRGTDNGLYHIWYSGAWSAWEGLGAPSTTLSTTTTLKSRTLSTTTMTALTDLTHQPPGTYPPVSLAIKLWNPSLHEVTWDWDGVHGFSYFQVYKLDPTSPSGRLVRDQLSYKDYWDTSFVAPNSTTYRIVGYHADGSWGSADVPYPNPPQPVAPAGFSGIQVSTGAVKFSWQTLPGAVRYRLFGPALPAAGLPVGSAGVSNLPATYVVTGIPIGTQTFSIATEYLAGLSPARTSASITVRPTSGNYRVIVTGVRSNHESTDNQFSFDGKGDEIYLAAFWAVLPFQRAAPTATGLVQTVVYGDAKGTPTRVQAGSGSPTGGIRSGDVVPDGFTPDVRPLIPAQPNRFPLLVWQGTLRDSGDIVAIDPLVWETDNNQAFNFTNWLGWFLTPNGGAILRDVAYASRSKPIQPLWFGELAENGFPMQPGIDPAQGTDRPIGIGGLVLEFAVTMNANSIPPKGVVLTREQIEQALGAFNAMIVQVRYSDRPELSGDYTIYLQIERVP